MMYNSLSLSLWNSFMTKDIALKLVLKLVKLLTVKWIINSANFRWHKKSWMGRLTLVITIKKRHWNRDLLIEVVEILLQSVLGLAYCSASIAIISLRVKSNLLLSLLFQQGFSYLRAHLHLSITAAPISIIWISHSEEAIQERCTIFGCDSHAISYFINSTYFQRYL